MKKPTPRYVAVVRTGQNVWVQAVSKVVKGGKIKYSKSDQPYIESQSSMKELSSPLQF